MTTPALITELSQLPPNTAASQSTLYVLRTLENQQVPSALQRLFSPHDALLLSGDAVYIGTYTEKSSLPLPCYALESDVRARGLLAAWPAHTPLITHGVFVDLCAHYQKTVSWS